MGLLLLPPVQWQVLLDTQEPWDEDPMFFGTYEECAQVSEQIPSSRLVWIDPQIDDMSSVSIH